MIPKIELFLFVLGVVFSLKHIVQLVINVLQENPQPMKLTITNQALLYAAVAYVCTYIIYLF